MSDYEEEMIDALDSLNEDGVLWGVKAEFEAEGTRFLELLDFSRLVRKSSVRLAVKVGGAEAVRDLDELKRVGVDAVIAPMIESGYAVKKFNDSIERVFNETADLCQFLINFETSAALERSNEILEAVASSPHISGVVFGRVDFSLSSGLGRDAINDQQVRDVACRLASRMAKMEKLFIVGGGVSELSFDFMDELQGVRLDRFETRKVVFRAEPTLSHKDRARLLRDAMRFEIAWLKHKRQQSSRVVDEDQTRVKMLEERWLGDSSSRDG